MLTLNEETHKYYWDGFNIPSVSEIIDPIKDFSNVNPVVLENACNYGKAVHKTAELYLNGELDEDTLDENLKQPLSQIKLIFRNDINYKTEVKLCTLDYKFAGTIDILSEDSCSLSDIKTRKYNPLIDDLQLEAYGILSGMPDKFIIELLPNQPYNIVRVKNRQARSMFLYMLKHWYATKDFEKKLWQWKNYKN